MQLDAIKPGMEIEYYHLVSMHKNKGSRHKVRIGTVKQVTPRMIAVQGKKYPDTILVNDLLSGQAAIVKIKQEGEVIMSKPKREAPTREELRVLWIKNKAKIEPIRKELGVTWADAKKLLVEAGIIDSLSRPIQEEQTPTPAPETVGSQEPVNEGSTESAIESIPENIPEVITNPVTQPKCSPQYLAVLIAMTEITAGARSDVQRVLENPVALALIKELIEQEAV
jgi:hypothetical protein